MWSLNLVTAPANQALDLESEVVSYLRASASEKSDQATILAAAIAAATAAAETFLQRQLIKATWELWLDEWDGCEIRIPRAPLQQQAGNPVDHGVLSIKYLDANGTEQTLATDQYQILAPAGPFADRGRVFLAYGVTLPAIRSQPGTVKFRFTAGYGDDYRSVPAGIKVGLLKRTLSIYDGRSESEVVPVGSTAESWWWPYRTW